MSALDYTLTLNTLIQKHPSNNTAPWRSTRDWPDAVPERPVAPGVQRAAKSLTRLWGIR